MRSALLVVSVLLLTGCKSADELYNEGQALELRGDYEAAAYHYAEALRKQPGLRKAQGRLLEAGKLALGQRLARLAEAEAAGAWVEAADDHRGLDGLVGAAQRAGVTLALPADYAERRAANLDAAVATLLERGGAALARGAFADALAAYDRAEQYDPTPEAVSLLAEARLDATAGWAEADLAAGRYRAAFDRAGQALAFVPPGSAAAALVTRIQTEALGRGSLRAAFAPVQPTRRAGNLPRGFAGALTDALELDGWTQPPPFILTLESALVRRALRDLGLDGPLGPGEAARLGSVLGVDAVFAGEIERFERTVTEKKREEKQARTRTGDRATYTRIEEEITLSATLAFTLVESGSGAVLCAEEVSRSERDRTARGEVGGSLRALDLGRAERRLFDADARAEDERNLEDELIDALAGRAAEAAFGCLLAEVP